MTVKQPATTTTSTTLKASCGCGWTAQHESAEETIKASREHAANTKHTVTFAGLVRYSYGT